jgi:hypothetical protein
MEHFLLLVPAGPLPGCIFMRHIILALNTAWPTSRSNCMEENKQAFGKKKTCPIVKIVINPMALKIRKYCEPQVYFIICESFLITKTQNFKRESDFFQFSRINLISLLALRVVTVFFTTRDKMCQLRVKVIYRNDSIDFERTFFRKIRRIIRSSIYQRLKLRTAPIMWSDKKNFYLCIWPTSKKHAIFYIKCQ